VLHTVRTALPPQQRVLRILRKLACFRCDVPLPQGIALAPGEECLGCISAAERSIESLLTTKGSFFRDASSWSFVPYAEIDVEFPEKSDIDGALTVRTPTGTFDLLRGRSDLWQAGRFFMRCAADAKGCNYRVQ
jgi:hypothetical protein